MNKYTLKICVLTLCFVFNLFNVGEAYASLSFNTFKKTVNSQKTQKKAFGYDSFKIIHDNNIEKARPQQKEITSETSLIMKKQCDNPCGCSGTYIANDYHNIADLKGNMYINAKFPVIFVMTPSIPTRYVNVIRIPFSDEHISWPVGFQEDNWYVLPISGRNENTWYSIDSYYTVTQSGNIVSRDLTVDMKSDLPYNKYCFWTFMGDPYAKISR